MPLICIDSLGAAGVEVDQFWVVETEQRKDRGVEVVHMEPVFHRVLTNLVGGAVHGA